MKNTVIYPLTQAQKRIWITQNIYPDSPMFNIGGVARIKGSVDIQKLERALCHFFNTNNVFSVRLIECKGDIAQYFMDVSYNNLSYYDFSNETVPEQALKEWVNKEVKKVFQLLEMPLFSCVIFKVNENDYGFFLKCHHIVSDGWSMQIFLQKVTKYYNQILQRGDINSEEKNSYIEFVDNEEKYLKSGTYEKNKAFWMREFHDMKPNKKVENNSISGCRKSFFLSRYETKKIREFVTQNMSSVNIFFITTYLLYLYKIFGKKDIIIGTPILGRINKKERDIFGMFVNTIPFRFCIDEHETILDMMIHVFFVFKQCFVNQRYPYNQLINELNLKKKEQVELYNTCINYYKTDFPDRIGNASLKSEEIYCGEQEYNLQIFIRDEGEDSRLKFDFDYHTSIYTEYQIEKMFDMVKCLMKRILEDNSRRVKDINIQPVPYEYFLKYNNTQVAISKDKTVMDYFIEQVRSTPERIALEQDEIRVTYLELAKRAYNLSLYLKKQGVSQEIVVGIYMYNSIELIISIIAVLWAGGGIVPLDTNYPMKRIEYIIKNSNINMVITNIDTKKIMESVEVVNINYVEKNFDDHFHKVDLCTFKSTGLGKHIAYIIYTSGSTGDPKGVMVEHHSLINYLLWAKDYYFVNKNDAFPLFTSIAFDLTLTSVFLPLICGGKCIIYKNDDTEYVLYRIFRENKVTVIKMTPSQIKLLRTIDLSDSKVKKYILGGEELKSSIANEIFDKYTNIEIFNEYGPTEATVGCMIYKCEIEEKNLSVPIGKPINNTHIYLLDENNKMVPLGYQGEICISGDGVARGYMYDDELTQKKFIENPFEKGTKMYKTGDLGRFIDDYTLEYLGRKDAQIKVNGFRIELQEIETAILQYEGVNDVVVFNQKENNDNNCLIAYIESKQEVDSEKMREFLAFILPYYMIPSFFVRVEKIPLTLNGKIDKRPLIRIKKNMIEPENTMYSVKESILLIAACEVLHCTQCGINDNFYHKGGDSIKAIQLSSKIREKGYVLKISDILLSPIFGEMVTHMEKLTNEEQPAYCTGIIAKTPIIKWFFLQKNLNLDTYCQSISFTLNKAIDIGIMKNVYHKILKCHDILRVNYNKKTGELYFNEKYIYTCPEVEIYNLRHVKSDKQEEIKQILNKVKCNFDIENSILIKLIVIQLTSEDVEVHIIAHHLVVDAVSWRILIDDMNNIIGHIQQKRPFTLMQKHGTFQDYALKIQEYKNNISQKEINYWKEIMYKECWNPKKIYGNKTDKNEIIIVELDEEHTVKLLNTHNEFRNVGTYDVLLTALVMVIAEITNMREVVIELEGHGRDDILGIDTSHIMGWFTSIYPFYVKITNENIKDQLKNVRNELGKVPHNGIGYGIIKYLLTEFEHVDKKYIKFNYLGELQDITNENWLSLKNLDIDNFTRYENVPLIDVNGYIMDGRLHVTWRCDYDFVSVNQIEDMSRRFTQLVTEIINMNEGLDDLCDINNYAGLSDDEIMFLVN